ncbi:hypothetical protein D9M70_457910 [compost metagenome]
MLHLQAGVHLQEVEVALAVDNEFHGAGGVVADGLGKCDCLFAHGLAGLGVEERRGCLLDDLLVAALDRAFALAEIERVAILVAKHLDLDVTRLRHEFFDEDAIVAEGVLCLVL